MLLTNRSGGNDIFGATANLNDSNQVIIFKPDSVGTYKINFTNGSLTSNTLDIDRSVYIWVIHIRTLYCRTMPVRIVIVKKLLNGSRQVIFQFLRKD